MNELLLVDDTKRIVKLLNMLIKNFYFSKVYNESTSSK